jgi:predicted transcriptional regulator
MSLPEEKFMSRLPVVDDYMARTLIQFSPEENIHGAAKRLLEQRISGAPVIDADDNLVGMLSKKDCLQVVYNASYHRDWGGRVDEYMSREVQVIESGTSIIIAADLFVESNFRRFPVMENLRIVGQISRQDILRALYDIA